MSLICIVVNQSQSREPEAEHKFGWLFLRKKKEKKKINGGGKEDVKTNRKKVASVGKESE